MHRLACLLLLLLAMPAAAQWNIDINDGRPVAVVPGGATDFEVVVTRQADTPASTLTGFIQADPPPSVPPYPEPVVFFTSITDGRCQVLVLPLPPTSTFFMVSGVAPGETVRCRARVQASAHAAPGSYRFQLGTGAGAVVPFLVDVGTALPVAIPAGSPLGTLICAFWVMVIGRRVAGRHRRGRA